jgi:hypothetical protein
MTFIQSSVRLNGNRRNIRPTFGSPQIRNQDISLVLQLQFLLCDISNSYKSRRVKPWNLLAHKHTLIESFLSFYIMDSCCRLFDLKKETVL